MCYEFSDPRVADLINGATHILAEDICQARAAHKAIELVCLRS